MFQKQRKKLRRWLFKRLAAGVSDHDLQKQLRQRSTSDYRHHHLRRSKVARARLETIIDLIRPVPVGNSIIRLGREHDGGYLCIDNFEDCDAVVSCGISDDVSFDLCFAERGIQVYQYDDSIAEPPESHPQFRFKQWRVSGEACHERGEHTLTSILSNDLRGRSNAVVKIDIESSEWAALEQCDPQILRQHVAALYIEFHELSELLNDDFYQRALDVFTQLRKDYVPICFHPNNCGDLFIFGNRAFPDTFELSYIRKDVVKPVVDTPAARADAQINSPSLPDVHVGALMD